jgi:plasmid stabilization system protein ParE
VTRVFISARAVRDFQRIADFVESHDPGGGPARISAIITAINVLATSPRIGRPAAEGHRELVIGRGARGYVALYAHLPARDLVVIAAIRGQREAGYAPAEEDE